ncbi:MAG: hypothetical protein JOZ54_15630 [Acidobacteria bacterium]|nr:hypothetical protein [Acidobacteriota bacterium]
MQSRFQRFSRQTFFVVMWMVIIGWLAVAWETSTGLAFTRRYVGHIASAQEKSRTRTLAIVGTVALLPLAVCAGWGGKR